MCGIAGAFALEPGTCVDRARVEQMTDLLAHRGPDGSGFWSSEDGRVGLGHRRLAVIDLETGAQPMVDPATRIAITFNGEIYNYRELRAGLESRGGEFRTASDTEVILRMYLDKGTEAIEDFRGMFAFAIWDPRRESLLLARDRVGKKPLYYTVRDGILYFGSSFHSVLSRVERPDAVNVEQIATFLTLGYIPAPRTVHPHVFKFSAGTIMEAGPNGLNASRYWDVRMRVEPFRGSWNEAVDYLEETLLEAVRIRLRSNVPLGVLLSGGIDSSLVAAMAARCTPEPIRTFTVGFGGGGGEDERYWAGEIARRIGSRHQAFEVKPDSLRILPEIVRHFGEPFADPSAIPLWTLSREMRKHVTVAVAGDGGDEGFGGYDWYRTASRLNALARAIPGPLGGRLVQGSTALADRTGPLGRLARGGRLLGLSVAERYAALRSSFDPSLARRLFSDRLLQAYENVETEMVDTFSSIHGQTRLQQMRTADFDSYLADCLMPKSDVASMAHGLELRAPLLDQHVVAFAIGLPDAWISTGKRGKLLLRALLARYLPADLFERRKQGFDPPLDHWFRTELRAEIEALPTSPILADTGWFDMTGLRDLVAEHLRGDRNHTHRLFHFLTLNEWLSQR